VHLEYRLYTIWRWSTNKIIAPEFRCVTLLAVTDDEGVILRSNELNIYIRIRTFFKDSYRKGLKSDTRHRRFCVKSLHSRCVNARSHGIMMNNRPLDRYEWNSRIHESRVIGSKSSKSCSPTPKTLTSTSSARAEVHVSFEREVNREMVHLRQGDEGCTALGLKWSGVVNDPLG
jgi:hypothetical protein